MASKWDTDLNSIHTRADLAEKYGGSVYSGGIVVADASANIFLYSDPTEGPQYGYSHDGWSADGVAFEYTGAGNNKDHEMTDRNRAVLEHESRGRALRLFVADGTVPGTNTKLQRYVGEYRVDPSAPWEYRPSSSGGVTHAVIVFRLLAVGDAATEALPPKSETPDIVTKTAVLVSKEVNSSFFFETSGSGPSTAEKIEGALVEEFVKWLGGPASRTMRWSIPIVGEKTTYLLTDIYDTFTKRLWEAKGSAQRTSIRLAIGQLMDYERHLPIPGLAVSLLLPRKPSSDLLALLERHGIGVSYKVGPGKFEEIEGDPIFGPLPK